MKRLLDVSNLNNIEFTGVSFIDDIVGLGEKRITLDMKHFKELNIKTDQIQLVINRKSLNDYKEERNKELLQHENYAEFDHLNSMLAMLEHDFISIDKLKLFYRDNEKISGEYVIDTSDEDKVGMKSEFDDASLILSVVSV